MEQNKGKSVTLMICITVERKKLKTKYKTNGKYLAVNVISRALAQGHSHEITSHTLRPKGMGTEQNKGVRAEFRA